MIFFLNLVVVALLLQAAVVCQMARYNVSVKLQITGYYFKIGNGLQRQPLLLKFALYNIYSGERQYKFNAINPRQNVYKRQFNFSCLHEYRFFCKSNSHWDWFQRDQLIMSHHRLIWHVTGDKPLPIIIKPQEFIYASIGMDELSYKFVNLYEFSSP